MILDETLTYLPFHMVSDQCLFNKNLPYAYHKGPLGGTMGHQEALCATRRHLMPPAGFSSHPDALDAIRRLKGPQEALYAIRKH